MSKTIDYELDDKNEIVNAIRGSQVSQLFVEFLQQGGPKPHVVLRLNINPTFDLEGDTWMGCRLAMDLAGGYDGVFHITPLPYNSASHAAHAAFEFKVKVDWTVENIISTISPPTADLLDFSFAGGFMQPGSKIEYFDGCRDFITQFFIILHRWGVVGWHVHSIDKGSFNSKNLDVVRGRTGFHQIIGYNYTTKSTSKSTVVENLPLARGTFSSQNFRRTVIYHADDKHRYQLPYHPAALQSGDDGFDTLTSQSAGTSEGSASMYNPQSAEPGQGSGYVDNSQQKTTEDPISPTQQTYPSEWTWSEEYKSWWRLKSKDQYEWSTGPQETSANETASQPNFVETYVISVTKDGVLECPVDGSTKRLRREGFRWVEGVERYVYVGNSGLEYRLQSLEPEGKGKGKKRA